MAAEPEPSSSSSTRREASTCRRSSSSTRCCGGSRDAGAACVLYSSDTEELVGLCDRVAVFHDGVPAMMLEGDEVTQDAVVAASFAVARESHERVRRDPSDGGARTAMPRVTWHRSYTAAAARGRALPRLPPQESAASDSIQALGITNAALPLALVGGRRDVRDPDERHRPLGRQHRHALERHRRRAREPRPRRARGRARGRDRRRRGPRERADRLATCGSRR